MGRLVEYVNAMINLNVTVIVVPKELRIGASKEELRHARALAKINGVKLVLEGR